MDELAIVREFAKKLPKFPDGRIDYTNSDSAATVACYVMYKGKVLLLKRSNKVGSYKGKWNVVAGYLDELKPIRYKVLEELREELGIAEQDIESMRTLGMKVMVDKGIAKTWMTHPFLVTLKREPKITIDWEHTEYRWVAPSELAEYDTVPGIKEALAEFQP